MRIAPFAGIGVGSLVVGLVAGAIMGRGDNDASAHFGRSQGEGERADLEAQVRRLTAERDEAIKARDALAAELGPGTPGVDAGGALQRAQQELAALRAQLDEVRKQADAAIAAAQQELAAARQQLADLAARGEKAVAEATVALQARIADLERELQNLRRQSEEARAESARWRETAQQGTQQIEALRRDVERLEAALRATRGFGGG